MPRSRGRGGGGGGGKKGGRNTFGDTMVTDSFRIGVNLALKNFRHQEEDTELEFPTSFSKTERAYVHKMAVELAIKSKSRGNGQNRYITVYKNEGSTIVAQDAILSLTKVSKEIVTDLLQKYPVSGRERADLLPITDRSLPQPVANSQMNIVRSMGRLGSSMPKVPETGGGQTLLDRRRELPIWEYRQTIVQTIRTNQVVLISGDTGSGKTTQVPQFLLEEAHASARPVRVVVCQPRRLAATTVAERVAQERDEQLGDTIGYQIRLDSCTSARNLVTFCTYGVLLRSLMGGDQISQTLTHVIVDEVHERDKLSDFLLTVIREILERNANLKLILMSATVDSKQFLSYFPGCAQVTVPGRMYPVEEFYLEDILDLVNYGSGKKKKQSPVSRVQPTIKQNSSKTAYDADDVVLEDSVEVEVDNGDSPSPGDPDERLDTLLASCFRDGSPDKFAELFNVLETDISRLNYQHSERGVTILMVAAAWGALDLLEFALGLGANLHLRAPNGWTALQFTGLTNQTAAAEILTRRLAQLDDFVESQDEELTGPKSITEEQKELLEKYQKSFDDDEVDHDLIVSLISHLLSGNLGGSVLVFLPGYEDIISIKDLILQHSRLKNKASVLTLHSQMATSEHRKAFEPAKPGFVKVILSTNIAETGITLNDVVYVIDSGKVKEKSFDALTNSSMLKSSWISQSSATQRKGRAGRCQPGQVYRLFSSIRYLHLSPYQTPEILRTPLLELCLQTKLLAPPNTPIADFLAKVPEPPAFLVTRNAVQALKTMEALDQWEEVTQLGSLLLDIPLDPVYGKMLIYGVALMCLDPVLTICCCFSYRDPFLINSDVRSKNRCNETRKRLAGNTFSDHNALLNAYLEWDLAKQTGKARSWCNRNNVSHSTMEMICGMKSQVLNHLKKSGFMKAKTGGYNSNTYNQYNCNSNNWSIVKACLVAGLYPNVARYDRVAGQLRTFHESRVRIHPGSVCADLNKKIKTGGLPSEWCVYTEMTRVGRTTFIQGVSFISSFCVGLLCGPTRLPPAVWEAGERTGQVNHFIEESSDSEEEEHSPENNIMLNLDPWISLRSSVEDAQILMQLRQKWTSLWFKKLFPGNKINQDESDNLVVSSVGELLQTEDQAQNLIPPRPNSYRSPLAEAIDRVRLDDTPKLHKPSNHNQHSSASSPGPFHQQPPAANQRQGVYSSGDTSYNNTSGGSGGSHLPTSYLIVRPSPGSLMALEAAKSHGKTAVWSFSPSVERKLTGEIHKGRSVIVLFNVSGTQAIQGCAVLSGQVMREGNRVGQKVEWLGKHSVDMSFLSSHFANVDMQPGKDICEIPSDMAQSIINRMSTLEATNMQRSNDWSGRGKFYRRNNY